MSLSGRLLQITIIRANRFLSSYNSTVSQVHGTLTFLAMDFHVWSFCFFIVDHRLILPNWIRSLTNVSKSFWRMSLCPTRSLWTFSGTTTFVTSLKSLPLSWLKGFVKLYLVFSMFFSWRESNEAVNVWWWVPAFAVDVPAISFASSARRVSSGAMTKNFAFRFKMIPNRPPEAFMDRFICSRAWSAPSAQNATSSFLLTTQLPSRNSW